MVNHLLLFLDAFPDKPWNWTYLSENANAIHLLFPYDYKNMKLNNKMFFEELTKYVFNPVRMNRLCKMYNVEFDEYLELV